MLFRPVLASCLVLIVSPMCLAAIVYEPVRDQYRDPYCDTGTFYYGGHDPLVLHRARMLQRQFNIGPDANLDIVSSFVTEGRFGYNLLHRRLIEGPPVVTYSDLLPSGTNAYPYGINPTDARNDSYASMPRYFTKRELLASAHVAHDGTIVVPANAPLPGTIEITPQAPTTQPSTQSTVQPLMIIPKRLLNQPLKSSAQPVALGK